MRQPAKSGYKMARSAIIELFQGKKKGGTVDKEYDDAVYVKRVLDSLERKDLIYLTDTLDGPRQLVCITQKGKNVLR